MVPLAAFLTLAFVQSLAEACLGPEGTLTISNRILSPDGFPRSAVVANDVHPGPLIKSTKGDRISMNVLNRLTDDTMLRSTAIHWHGINQKTKNYLDGTTGVTQCPISPGHDFLYEFDIIDQAGTFWYHAHAGSQYCDGLRGPFVVYDSYDPHKYLYDVDDESTIITLADWNHKVSPQMGLVDNADSTLINGKGRFFNGPKVDLAVVNVHHGKRYRIRLIAMSCELNYHFSIDGHKLTVIEADGESTKPLTVDSIQILAGQRYSFVLHANQPIDNYWIRALPNFGNNLTSFDGGINSAILRYHGADLGCEPTTQQKKNPILLDEAKLRALENPRAPGLAHPGGADVNINLDIVFNVSQSLFFVNGVNYKPPDVPVLLQILSGAQSAQDLLPAGSIYKLPKNKVVEVSLPATMASSPGAPHPFHLHGHSFSVVRSAGPNNTAYNYEDPVRRDVVSMGDTGSNTTIRFKTDNPGPWMFHCHIDPHRSIGLLVVFVEDLEEERQVIHPTKAWDKLCPTYDSLPASATAVINGTATP